MRSGSMQGAGAAGRRWTTATVCLGTALAAGLLAPAASAAEVEGQAPETPSDLRVVTGSAAACDDGSPAALRSTTPTLRARISDPDPGNVAATFTLVDAATDAVLWGPLTTTPEASGSDQAVQVWPNLLAHGGDYRWTVSAVDAEGNRSAEASCRFTVDLVAPDAPTVAPVAGEPAVYLEDQWSGNLGVRGSFTFGVQDLPSSADVVGFRYSFDSSALDTEVSVTSPTVSFTPTASAHRLVVQAVDAAGWTSPVREYRFSVGRSAPAEHGSIGGTVTGTAGVPLPGVVVEARDETTETVTRATTSADGRYEIPGLVTGSYLVTFTPPAGTTPAYAPEFYDDATSEDLAEPVFVFRGRAVTGIDAALTALDPGFVDVPAGAPFFTEITWLREQGITTGVLRPDGTRAFDPAGPVRREAMAAFLYRAAGSPAYTAPAESPFVDVPVGASFYTEIAWLHEQGITTGTQTPAGREFRPAEPMTREAVAAFLHRRAGSPETSPGTTFVDVDTEHPFAEEIAWLASSGITTGTDLGDGTFEFRPSELVRREAIAAFLYRAR